MMQHNDKVAFGLYVYIYIYTHILVLVLLACNPCKRMNAFEIKHNFYYENINNQSNY